MLSACKNARWTTTLRLRARADADQLSSCAIVGVVNVARFMRALSGLGAEMGMVSRPLDVNGEPGMIFTTDDGLILGVLSLDISDGQVQAIHAVINPDKLQHPGAVGDLRALVEQSRGPNVHTPGE